MVYFFKKSNKADTFIAYSEASRELLLLSLTAYVASGCISLGGKKRNTLMNFLANLFRSVIISYCTAATNGKNFRNLLENMSL